MLYFPPGLRSVPKPTKAFGCLWIKPPAYNTFTTQPFPLKESPEEFNTDETN